MGQGAGSQTCSVHKTVALTCINAWTRSEVAICCEQTQLSATMATGRSYTMSASAIQHQGKSFPLGATLRRGGANFSGYAKHSRATQILLFDRVNDREPTQ